MRRKRIKRHFVVYNPDGARVVTTIAPPGALLSEELKNGNTASSVVSLAPAEQATKLALAYARKEQEHKLKVRLGIQRLATCAMCTHEFLSDTLHRSISYSAIIKQREAWGLVDSRRITPSQLYAKRNVCEFCAQFFGMDRVDDAKLHKETATYQFSDGAKAAAQEQRDNFMRRGSVSPCMSMFSGSSLFASGAGAADAGHGSEEGSQPPEEVLQTDDTPSPEVEAEAAAAAAEQKPKKKLVVRLQRRIPPPLNAESAPQPWAAVRATKLPPHLRRPRTAQPRSSTPLTEGAARPKPMHHWEDLDALASKLKRHRQAVLDARRRREAAAPTIQPNTLRPAKLLPFVEWERHMDASSLMSL